MESGWGDLEADKSMDDVSSSNVVDEESVRSAGGGTWSMIESQSGGISATTLALASRRVWLGVVDVFAT